MITGIEVAGLVLGALPLLISALEQYNNGLRIIDRAWKYKREIASIRRLLLAEQTVFQNTCERLWIDLVSSEELEELLQGVRNGDRSYQHLDAMVESRLGTSYETYFSVVSDMASAVATLKEELTLDDPSESPVSLATDIAHRLVLGLSLSLSNGRFENLLKRIEKNNNILRNLTSQSLDLEPLRKRKKIATRGFTMVRDQANSLYEAIRARVVCQCAASHEIQLTLGDRVQQSIAQARMENGGQTKPDTDPLRFRISFVSDEGQAKPRWSVNEMLVMQYKIAAESLDTETQPGLGKASVFPPDRTNKSGEFNAKESKKSRLRILSSSKRTSKAARSPDKPSISNENPSSKGVKFALPDRVENSTETTVSDIGTEISNLCQSLQSFHSSAGLQQNTKEDRACIGYLSCEQSVRFGLYLKTASIESVSSPRTHASLLDAISRSHTDHGSYSKDLDHIWKEPISRGRRLKVASILASSLLQLYDTPWLPNNWSSADIILHGGVSRRSDDDTGVFISKKLGHDRLPEVSSIEPAQSFPGLRNTPIFTLGLVLVELCFWKSMSSLWTPEDTLGADGLPNVVTRWCTATRLLTSR